MNSETNESRRNWLATAGAGWAAAMLAALPAQTGGGTWPPITAFPSGRWTPGRWVWVDLFVDDAAVAQRFYGAVFDWRFNRTDALDGRYILVHAGDEMVAGLIAADPDGTAFGVLHAEGGDADHYLAELNEWVWLELWAREAPPAVSFLQ